MTSDLIKSKIKRSSEAFVEKMWPKIEPILGGGKIVPVESVSDQDFFKQYLDAYGGVDTWHIDDKRCLMRGLATRMQRTKKLFQTITIRYHRMSGANTEIHKRLKSLQEPGNWLHPSLVIQGYFLPDGDGYGEPRAVAVARMNDVISVVANGEQGTSFSDPRDWYIDQTSERWGNSDKTQFAVIPVKTLERIKAKVHWAEF